MTILHVLKYPPRRMVQEWLHNPITFNDILPNEIADTVYGSFVGTDVEEDTMTALIEKVLMEYEGPL